VAHFSIPGKRLFRPPPARRRGFAAGSGPSGAPGDPADGILGARIAGPAREIDAPPGRRFGVPPEPPDRHSGGLPPIV